MPFDRSKHVIRVQGGREYLPVSGRLIWFRGEHPDWGIVTTPIEINLEKNYAIFTASIFNSEGKLMATSHKFENARGFQDFIEKAETGSVGRALALCGYGTDAAPELDEGTRLADTPGRKKPVPVASGGVINRPAPRAGGNGVYTNNTPPPPDDRSDDEPIRDLHGNEIQDPFDDDAPERAAPDRCEVCQKVMTPSQVTMSRNKYGRPLCPVHQKEVATR